MIMRSVLSGAAAANVAMMSAGSQKRKKAKKKRKEVHALFTGLAGGLEDELELKHRLQGLAKLA